METLEIPEGKYLGTLCKRGHDWEGTGKSLRYKNGDCVKCAYKQGGLWKKENKDKVKVISHNSRKRNADTIRKYNKNYREAHKEIINKWKCINAKKHIDKTRIRSNRWSRNNIKNLGDSYIKGKIAESFRYKEKVYITHAEIPQELVEAHRIILKIKRKLKEKEGQNA